MILFIVVFSLLGVGGVLVIYGSIVKNDWGINLGAVSCPHCGAPLSPVRRPRSLRQAMWGGGTCAACGTQVDKWGRELSNRGRRTNLAASNAQSH